MVVVLVWINQFPAGVATPMQMLIKVNVNPPKEATFNRALVLGIPVQSIQIMTSFAGDVVMEPGPGTQGNVKNLLPVNKFSQIFIFVTLLD